jgi:hypothetical protein
MIGQLLIGYLYERTKFKHQNKVLVCGAPIETMVLRLGIPKYLFM